MLHELAKSLGARLKTQGVPLPVISGPERAGSNVHERIVVERDRNAGDTFESTIGQHLNPKSPCTNVMGCLLRVYAKSPIAGATVSDHERRADAVVDRAIAALDRILRGQRRNWWETASGKFVAPEDLAGTETWPGALYELRFTVKRSVLDLTWPTAANPAGAARPTGTFEGVIKKVDISLPGGAVETVPFGSDT